MATIRTNVPFIEAIPATVKQENYKGIAKIADVLTRSIGFRYRAMKAARIDP